MTALKPELSKIIAEAEAGKLDWRSIATFPAEQLTTDEAYNRYKASANPCRQPEYRKAKRKLLGGPGSGKGGNCTAPGYARHFFQSKLPTAKCIHCGALRTS